MFPLTHETPIARELIQSSLPVVIFDAELRITWANEAAGMIGSGLPGERWPGYRLGEVLPGLNAGLIERSARGVLATGQPAAGLQVAGQDSGDPCGEQFWSCIQFPVKGPEGACVGVVHAMWETTESARNQRRLALAGRAGRRIGTALDITRTAEELLGAAVPGLADAGAVDLLATVIEGGTPARRARGGAMRLRQVAMRWPEFSAVPADSAGGTWLDTDPAKLYHQRLVAGLPVFVPQFADMSTEQIERMDSGAGLRRLLAAQAAGVHSLMVIPLAARGVILGPAVFYRLSGSGPFSRADLSLARDLAGRAAVAIDNARLYTRERACALTLQRGLLPRQIPSVPGLDLAYGYVPAETSAEAGGDWFDVVALSPTRSALIVGDVTGHDIRAASVMGQLRTATRTLATLGLTPAEILTRLDQITADLTDEETSATCIYAAHDADTGEWDMARAGHPLPAVVRPGHHAAFLDLPPGVPLGIGAGAGHYESTRVHLPRGSTLVLYTDGLIESRTTDMRTGMACLADILTRVSKLAVGEACDSLLTALASAPDDDIALLIART